MANSPQLNSGADPQVNADIPLLSASSEAIPGPVADLIGPLPAKKILIVNDDASACEMIARTVTRAGFRADVARDGEEGWDALCRRDYDLVITDNELPKLTGVELIERIREISVEPPCILISGSLPGVESIFKSLIHPGAVLGKPFSPTALIEKVYSLLLHGDSAVS